MKRIISFISIFMCMTVYVFSNNTRGNTFIFFNQSFMITPNMADLNDTLLVELRTGNAKNIARFFGSNITLSILNEDGLYSKYQAEMLLQGFLSKNKPSAVKLLQKITNKTNYSYYVYQLSSNKNLFRVFIKISLSKSGQTIEEFRVEKQASK
ncbi:hypothetical protein D3C87_1238970 [compost metagenome]|jgi:hypothetical protein|nr:uncharacterized protein DUF4783 [Sphingobacterium faecium]